MIDTEEIIEKCKRNDREAQKLLFETYSPVLFGICLRYARDKFEAEDTLQDGFLKILNKISDFNGTGSFEGWMKRIIINTAITNYHKNKKHNLNLDIEEIQETNIEGTSYNGSDYTAEELLKIVNTLPEGYKIVFNLYAIEGYKHKEIAEQLNIDINTSKSQYSRAKKLLRKKLELFSKIKINERQA
jgi:RNA polymerase sigma-70 factor (ECF subfamily)